MSAEFNEEGQQFGTSDQVVLYKLDCTDLGGDVYRFCAMTVDAQPIVYDGLTYTPIDIESEGWETNGRGSFPKPKIRISNVKQLLSAVVIEFSDLLGATLTRIRTYKKFLDGEAGANPTAYIEDIFTVSRKSSQNRLFIEWELSAVVDQQGRRLPARQYLKDACTHIYRVYTDGAFVYTKATCPYTGTNYFNQQGGVENDPSDDRCGKRLSDCRARFGQHGTLPFRGFPGLGKTPNV